MSEALCSFDVVRAEKTARKRAKTERRAASSPDVKKSLLNVIINARP
jgi:hypothetical protein